ncbi:hypothetical protein SLEP1_g60543, partial [Rubroshorea leprosula]
LSSAR